MLKELVTKAHLPQKEDGQGLVEYALILVLVAIVVIAILLLLGPVVGNVFSNITCNLQGGSCTVVSAPGAPSDPYADYWATAAYEPYGTASSINYFCNETAPGTSYKVYDAGSGWRVAGGSATNASDRAGHTQIGTGTCP